MEIPCEVRNEVLYNNCKQFITSALYLLEPYLCKEILREIEKKPEAETIFCYRLLNPSPLTFDGLILRHQQDLEQTPEYIQFDEMMRNDNMLSKNLGLIGTSRLKAAMFSSSYLFYVLKKLLTEFLLRDSFNEGLFNKLYCDLESFFYSDVLPVKDITPLFNFKMNIDTIQLDEGLAIRKITNDEMRIFFDEVVDIGISSWSIGEIEYVIEYKHSLRKVSGLTETGDPYGITLATVRKLATILRLFKSGNLGFLFTRPFGILDIPIKPGGTVAGFSLVPVRGEAYNLVTEEISQFLELWNFMSHRDFYISPLDLALGRFNSAYEKILPEDKIVDYAISFEALFSGDGVESVAHKLALRVSRLIEQDVHLRKQVYTAVKGLYNKRNQIVHGHGRTGQASDVKNMESYLRKAIVEYIRKGLSHTQLIDQIDYA